MMSDEDAVNEIKVCIDRIAQILADKNWLYVCLSDRCVDKLLEGLLSRRINADSILNTLYEEEFKLFLHLADVLKKREEKERVAEIKSHLDKALELLKDDEDK